MSFCLFGCQGFFSPKRRKTLLTCLTAVGLSLPSMPVAADPPIVIATGEYVPWTTERSTHGGFVNRVIREAFSRKGISVEFRYLPWKRVYEESRAGNYQATSFWFDAGEYHEDFLFSQPISQHRELLFHLASKPLPQWKTIADLSAFSFGATRGYTYTQEFWSAIESGRIKAEVASNDESNLRKLLAGRIDVFPLDEVTAWRMLSDSRKFPAWNKDLLRADPVPLHETTGHLLFPIKGPQSMRLQHLFDAGLAEMKKDGTFNHYKDDMFKEIY